MAYQVAETCYDDLTSGLDAWAAQITGQVYSNAGTVFTLTATRTGSNVVTITGTDLSTGAVAFTRAQTIATLPNCGKFDIADTLDMSWLVVAVWLGVWGFLQFRRAT